MILIYDDEDDFLSAAPPSPYHTTPIQQAVSERNSTASPTYYFQPKATSQAQAQVPRHPQLKRKRAPKQEPNLLKTRKNPLLQPQLHIPQLQQPVQGPQIEALPS